MWINELVRRQGPQLQRLALCCWQARAAATSSKGRYVNLSKGGYADAPHNKLLTSIARAMGAKASGRGPVTHFGDTRYGEPGEYSQLVI